jgi:hypothetical protein
MSVRLLGAVAAALAAGALGAAPAAGEFGPIELQSVGPLDQADSATEPAISANGEYLAFQGSLDGVRGVFRKDLRDGQIELVAGGSAYDPAPGSPADASAPSISAEGRYVRTGGHPARGTGGDRRACEPANRLHVDSDQKQRSRGSMARVRLKMVGNRNHHGWQQMRTADCPSCA